MKMPECEREDCRFVQRSGMSTLAYYQPIYDKNGVNINPDMNTRTDYIDCLICGKKWLAYTHRNQTAYKELTNDT